MKQQPILPLIFFFTLFIGLSNPIFLSPDPINTFTYWISQYLKPNLPQPQPLNRGINGGFTCAACTIILSLSEQLTQIHNETLLDSLRRMCTYLPKNYVSECGTLVIWIYPMIAREVKTHTSPDSICYDALKFCQEDQPGKRCNLFPPPKGSNSIPSDKFDYESFLRAPPVIHVLEQVRRDAQNMDLPWICYLPGVKLLCQAIDSVYDKIVPALDLDGDRFSPAQSLRGSLWRGRDCSDSRVDIYPGRNSDDGDREYDANCNGISGVNKSSGRSLEDELCGGSGQRGVIFIGDSVTAHFHVPPKWFTPTELSPGILENITFVVSNEADWPHLGFSTGYMNSTMPDLIHGQTDSIYLRMRERNRCNHRDYQNLGRNGAESNSTDSYMLSMSRDKRRDHPAVVFYSLIANDVCNEHWDTEAHMTPPGTFYKNTMRTLRFLEKTLPPGSHVVLIGLVDGAVIYDAMADRMHPLGELNKNIRYTDMYRWFNCMEMGPCHGWMTSNDTLRRVTSKHAARLTGVLQTIAKKEKFPSFDIHFAQNPFRKVISDWAAGGGQVWQLIEPVDSLHPTQAAQPLIAKEFWKMLENEMPEVIGPVNPMNERIRSLFGEQGGH